MESTRSEERTTTGDTVVVRGCAVDSPPFRSILSVLDSPRTGWVSPTSAIVGGGETRTLTARGEDRFTELQTAAQALFEQLQTPESLPSGGRPRLFGGFSFSHGSRRDRTKSGLSDNLWNDVPQAQFVLPAIQVSVSSDGTWLTATASGPGAHQRANERLVRWRRRIETLPTFDVGGPPGVASRQRTPELSEWRDGIESVVDRIRRGDLRKVVLAQALSTQLESELDVVDVLSRLGESYASCYRFLVEPMPGTTFLGATPERLVSVRGDTVDTEALAGSIGRGETSEEDEWLEGELRNSEKNSHEHELVVEAIRQQLEDVSARIETGDRTVRRLSNVQHLQTPIRATLDTDRHVLELVDRLHPTPAVGGLPPADATETIEELETFDRGWYAAPVGWIDEGGNGTFVVAIRSAVARRDTATLFAGAGIVADSDPDEEWDELQLKFRPILDELTKDHTSDA